MQKWSFVALGLLCGLNLIDVILTRKFLDLGMEEGNPIVAGIAGDWRLIAVKTIVLAALLYKTVTSKPDVSRVCLLWSAVGFYTLAGYVNWSMIQQLQNMQ